MVRKTAIHELEFGPFSGGINTYSDPSKIQDNEVVDAVNFDFSLDGSFTSRPPWDVLYAEKISGITGSVNPECTQVVIGSFVYGGIRFVIFTSNHIGGDWASYVYYLEGPNEGTIAKIGDGRHGKAHRYANRIYLVPFDQDSQGMGLEYILSSGLTNVISGMPVGYASVVYKDRLWVSGRRNVPNNSRLLFSELGNFASWNNSINFFDVAPGDGDAVHELAIYQDNIVIFKDNATYILTYDQGPPQAVLQVINTEIGAMGPYCVGTYENSIFILKYNEVYQMSNYDFARVNLKLPFEFDETTVGNADWDISFWLSVVGDRLVVRFFNRLYIYNLRLQAWTRWESEDPSIHYLGPIITLDNTNTNLRRGVNRFVAGSSLTRNIDSDGPGSSGNWNKYIKLFFMEDQYSDTAIENGNVISPEESSDINLSLTTKQFGFGLSHRFKRLTHWGVDVFTSKEVSGTLIPFTIAYQTTWGELEAIPWEQLQSWQYPLTELPSISQIVPAGAGIHSRYIRFPTSIRFRLLQFKVELKTKGNTIDGPVVFYSITAFLAPKQLLSKAVN
jgi:hypothetical protein